MKRLVVSFASILSAYFVVYSAGAITLHNATVPLVGSENNGARVYVGIQPNTYECLYSGVYFSNPAELDGVLSIAMSAKIAEQTIRIDFNQPDGPGTVCTGFGIYLD